MKKFKILGCLSLMLVLCISVQSKSIEKKPVIQMAILLDTSGSMSGLIEQAKSQLWRVVNEFINTKKGGLIPEFEVALYEYGKSSLPSQEGFIRQIVPLTTDLDKISEELFALTTNGGSEFCGWVINNAVNDLEWSESNDALKVIFIAGNEPFTQGIVDYQESCKNAITKGIIVNTIFCGDHAQGISTKWKDGSLLADGAYMNIDHNLKVPHIEAPQDAEIAKLGQELNSTYIPYGNEGVKGKKRQSAEDKNAEYVAAETYVQRQVAKSSSFYTNEKWDLVDAVYKDSVKVEEMKEEELPEVMKDMNNVERTAYIKEQSEKRESIQEKIKILNEERKQYITQKKKDLIENSENTLDEAVVKIVREQAIQENYVFN